MDRFEAFSTALFQITRCWNRIAGEEMKRYGLRGSCGLYLTAVADRENGISAAELCRLCGKDKADISRAVTAMEKKGLLERRGGRRCLWFLTEKGREVSEEIRSKAAAAVDYAGQELSPEERAVFYDAIASIAVHLERFCSGRESGSTAAAPGQENKMQ